MAVAGEAVGIDTLLHFWVDDRAGCEKPVRAGQSFSAVLGIGAFTAAASAGDKDEVAHEAPSNPSGLRRKHRITAPPSKVLISATVPGPISKV